MHEVLLQVVKTSQYGSVRFTFIINHFKNRTLFNTNRLHHFIMICICIILLYSSLFTIAVARKHTNSTEKIEQLN